MLNTGGGEAPPAPTYAPACRNYPDYLLCTYMQGIHTVLNVIAASGAYITNVLVTYYADNFTTDDWDTIRSHLLPDHNSILKATIYLTYVTSAMVFIQVYVKKLANYCIAEAHDDCGCICKVTKVQFKEALS